MANAVVADPLITSGSAKGDQSPSADEPCRTKGANIALYVVTVRDVESDAVDIDVGGPSIGNLEVDVRKVLTVQPRHLGHEEVPIVLGSQVVFLRRPAAVVAGQVEDVDCSRNAGQNRGTSRA